MSFQSAFQEQANFYHLYIVNEFFDDKIHIFENKIMVKMSKELLEEKSFNEKLMKRTIFEFKKFQSGELDWEHI